MSDANRTQIGIIEEVTIGTTPATPAFETLRVTGANLSLSKTKVSSKEMRADRQVPDVITVQFDAAGDLPQEVSFKATDTLLRGGMASDWVYAPVRDNNGTGASNITSVSATDIVILAHDNTSAFKYGTPAAGHLVSASGFAGAGNNRVVRAGAGTSDTVIKAAAGTVDAAPAAAARVKVIGFEGAAGDITATSTGLGSTALDFTTLGLRAGMWVNVGGAAAGQQFATVGVSGWCRIAVAGIAATALTFDIKPATWGVDAGAAKTIRVFFGDVMVNGTTRRSYTIEQQFQDLATFEYYRGMVPVQMEYTAQQQSIMECKTTFMGMTATIPSGSRFAGAGDVAAPTNDVMNATSNVGTILINGALVAGNYVTQTSININNTGRRNTAVGSITSVDIKEGQFVATGKLSTYYGDATVLTLIRNSTAASYFLPMIDPTGTKALLFDMPKIKLGDGSPTVPGINADRMLDTDIEAVVHPTLGYTLSAQRLEAFGV